VYGPSNQHPLHNTRRPGDRAHLHPTKLTHNFESVIDLFMAYLRLDFTS
jgi:hypothetical protein